MEERPVLLLHRGTQWMLTEMSLEIRCILLELLMSERVVYLYNTSGEELCD